MNNTRSTAQILKDGMKRYEIRKKLTEHCMAIVEHIASLPPEEIPASVKPFLAEFHKLKAAQKAAEESKGDS